MVGILGTYLLYRELPLSSSSCKGEACLPTYNAFDKVLMRGRGFGFDYVMWGRLVLITGGGGGG